MSKITETEIQKIAKLAKLSIDSNDLAKRVSEFNDILAHIEKLSTVKTTSEPQSTGSVPDLEMFADEPKPCTIINEVLERAPSAEKPFFHIPKFIEGGKE